MKTLDEVIKAWSICFSDNSRSNCTGCPYADEDGEAACFNHDRTDALHYLMEFQGLSKMWNDKLDKEQENDPLTWEQLKQMEGKPVWVEYNFRIDDKEFRNNSKRWCIIREFKPWHDTEIIITENGLVLSKNEQIKDWQAYRKERQASGGSLVPDPRSVRIGEDTKITWHCPDKKE